jgi:hypothetical protein
MKMPENKKHYRSSAFLNKQQECMKKNEKYFYYYLIFNTNLGVTCLKSHVF